jgi:hypothetical protein
MSESFAWPEGAIWLWTGSASASALVAHATDMRATFDHGWQSYRTLDGGWHNRHTGQRAEVVISALTCRDNTALRALFEAQTAVHLHLRSVNSLNESAGQWLWSGVIDALDEIGREGDLTRLVLRYHCHAWSGY